MEMFSPGTVDLIDPPYKEALFRSNIQTRMRISRNYVIQLRNTKTFLPSYHFFKYHKFTFKCCVYLQFIYFLHRITLFDSL